MNNVACSLYTSKSIIFNAKYINGFIAPIYVDVRRTLGSVPERNAITQALIDVLGKHYPECNLVAGVCTAGTPFAAFMAHNLNMPMCYVRKTAKYHGLGKKIEGNISDKQRVVIVEDVIGSGRNTLNVLSTLREAKLDVLGVLSIFTYGMEKSIQSFVDNNIAHISLTNFNEVINLGLEKGIINSDDYHELFHYRDNVPDIALSQP
jgi:orotate phosphoribosyltransferase